MKKWLLLLCAVLLGLSFPAMAADQVSCPAGGFSFVLPDSFALTDLSDSEDPDLCLLLESKSMTISVFVSFVGNVSPDSVPFVLTGDETDMGSRKISGRTVQYIAGSSNGLSYYSCFWIRKKDGVTLDFRFTGKTSKAMKTVEKILDTLEWDD